MQYTPTAQFLVFLFSLVNLVKHTDAAKRSVDYPRPSSLTRTQTESKGQDQTLAQFVIRFIKASFGAPAFPMCFLVSRASADRGGNPPTPGRVKSTRRIITASGSGLGKKREMR